MSKSENRIKTATLYLILILSVILISVFLFPDVSRNISRILTRLGVIPMTAPQTFSWMVPPENLKLGRVVAYKSYAQDTEGNWRQTELKIFRVESVTTTPTTTTTTTHVPVTTTRKCVPEGGFCRSDKDCCSRRCTNNVCSPGTLGFTYWYLIPIVILVTIILVVVLFRLPRKAREEDEFERLKEKWSRRGFTAFFHPNF